MDGRSSQSQTAFDAASQHPDSPRLAHPKSVAVLIVVAIVLLIAGGFGLRHMALTHPEPPLPVQGR